MCRTPFSRIPDSSLMDTSQEKMITGYQVITRYRITTRYSWLPNNYLLETQHYNIATSPLCYNKILYLNIHHPEHAGEGGGGMSQLILQQIPRNNSSTWTDSVLYKYLPTWQMLIINTIFGSYLCHIPNLQLSCVCVKI